MRKFPIYVNNPRLLNRDFLSPIETRLVFTTPVSKTHLHLIDSAGREVPYQLCDTKSTADKVSETTLIFLRQIAEAQETFTLIEEDHEWTPAMVKGVTLLPVTQDDGYRRLDTGYYILELCSGKADGTTSGKWGIRSFTTLEEGKELIHNQSNAIGGFYGPFFTVRNGLINPPEHTKVNIVTEVEGPLYHRYRFSGIIPDGLDENLRNKEFSITFEFFYGSPIFRRQYFVDSFDVSVDGIPVKNKITVGDEFESGQGKTVFNRFSSYNGTVYRGGDLYADILASSVRKILEHGDFSDRPTVRTYERQVGGNLNAASWDFFWKMFCVKENLLTRSEIVKYSNQILPEAHKVTHQGPRNSRVAVREEVDVNQEDDQTIFPMSENKTAEFNTDTGYAMVWVTEAEVNRYQIVQRKESGWVNWGTNGEDEYPELPVGSKISTAYGHFVDWKRVADAMERPLIATMGMEVQ